MRTCCWRENGEKKNYWKLSSLFYDCDFLRACAGCRFVAEWTDYCIIQQRENVGPQLALVLFSCRSSLNTRSVWTKLTECEIILDSHVPDCLTHNLILRWRHCATTMFRHCRNVQTTWLSISETHSPSNGSLACDLQQKGEKKMKLHAHIDILDL